MKQTAVEWLVENTALKHLQHICLDEINQAKAMEKDQITEAWDKGNLPTPLGRTMTSEDYYKEIFK